jgi:hypothetical protein
MSDAPSRAGYRLQCDMCTSVPQALVPLFIEEDEDVLLAVWTATGAATAAVPKVRRGIQRLHHPAHALLQAIQQAAPVVCLL